MHGWIHGFDNVSRYEETNIKLSLGKFKVI
jgi:hypothetical protein